MNLWKKFLNRGMKFKLVTFFLLVGIIPLGCGALVSYWEAGTSLHEAELLSANALQDQVFSQLVALRDVKKGQIQDYFNECKTDIDVLTQNVAAQNKEAFERLGAVQDLKTAQLESYFKTTFAELRNVKDDPYTTAVVNQFNSLLASGDVKVGDKQWQKLAEKCDGRFKDVIKNTGWYDLFLINTDGQIVYSACRESDLGMNIPGSDLKDSSLGKAFSKAQGLDNNGIAIGDFEAYAPSNGNFTSFVMAKVSNKADKHLGYFALQLPTDTINKIVQNRAGLGKTGETYLVGRVDSKTSYRSDRVVKSGKIGQPKKGSDIDKALSGEQGVHSKIGSSGAPELVVYGAVKAPGLEWACITSCAMEEVLAVTAEGESEDSLAKFNNKYGYYDLFLISPNGYCFYSACHEADYQTNLVDGKYKDSNLGALVRDTLKNKSFGFVDFEPYAPSNGDPASFIAQTVVNKNGDIEMIVALQMPLDTVNRIMGVRAGMGETGETYLVGGDKRMRSDSFLDKDGHSVKASFAGTVEKNGVDTEAATDALAGKEDAKIILDYNGNPVLSAYTPVNVFGTRWALLAEIDEAEALATVEEMEANEIAAQNKLRNVALVIMLVAVVLIVGIAYVIAGMIIKPVKEVAGVLDVVATGDYTKKAQVDSKDELGRMADSLNVSIDAVAAAMQEVKDAAERERIAQEERAEEERRQAEAERLRKEEEDRREKEQAEQEHLRQEEQASKERQKAEEERQRAEVLRGKIDRLLTVVEAAAEGDLTQEITVEGDEAIDELAAGLKKMFADLSSMIGHVTESAAQFNEGSRVIAESSQTLASGAQTQSSSVEQMSAAVEQLTRSINAVTENSRQADSMAKETSQQAEEGGTAVQKSIDAMEMIRNSSEKISEIIQVVSEIAGQTNLLALNAAIEAARAGEHGMGFAVVADEVRKLAERSNQAAGEISGLIKESGEQVARGAELSDETGKSLKQIIESVEATAVKITEIATATTEQAGSATEVSSAIRGVAEVAEQSAAGSEQMASSSEELGAQASGLRDLVARFKTNESPSSC